MFMHLCVLFCFCQPQRLAAVKFIAHLVNQQVPEETIALELVSVLLETPTDDSVEVAVGFVTECGAMLQDVTPKGLHGKYPFKVLIVLSAVLVRDLVCHSEKH